LLSIFNKNYIEAIKKVFALYRYRLSVWFHICTAWVEWLTVTLTGQQSHPLLVQLMFPFSQKLHLLTEAAR